MRIKTHWLELVLDSIHWKDIGYLYFCIVTGDFNIIIQNTMILVMTHFLRFKFIQHVLTDFKLYILYYFILKFSLITNTQYMNSDKTD